MLKKLTLIIAAGMALFIAGGLYLSPTAHVERTIVINRPASTLFTLLNGYRSFSAWSPWAARDPGMTYEFSGPESGVGAQLDWQDDPRLVGSGWQKIVRSEPHSLIEMQLDFEQQGEALARFEFQSLGEKTRVRWVFDSDLAAGENFLTGILNRYFGLLFDRWVGSDYELGLANLKVLAESVPNADFSGLEVETVVVEPIEVLFVTTQSFDGLNDVDTAEAYLEIMTFIQTSRLEIASQPMAITRSLGGTGFAVDAAIPIVGEHPVTTGHVQFGLMPSGRAVRAVHHGPHANLIQTYQKLAAWMVVHGFGEGDVSWEQYISDPGMVSEDQLITHVYYLIREQQ